MRSWRAALIVCAVVFALDQLSKWVMLTHVLNPPRIISILPFFNFRLGFNTGISFGMFSELLARSPWLLIVFALAVAAVLLAWAIRAEQPMERTALALIAGGALGNVTDRWRQGAVTDFLDLHWSDWHWPTFNIADVAIAVGCLLLVLSNVRAGQPTKNETKPV